MRSIDFIASGVEEVAAFPVSEEITEVTDGAPKVAVGPRGRTPDKGLEFGEGHFNEIEIGAVGRLEQEPCTDGAHGLCGLRAFVGRQVVEDNHIAWLQRRGELCPGIKLEGCAVHCAVDAPWRVQPVMAQCGDERLGIPVAEGRVIYQARTFAGSPGDLGHVRFQRRLANEADAWQQVRHEWLSPCDPDMACVPDLRPLLLDGLKVIFV
nr:hypothetical protein [Aliiruegeria haliotis]